MAKQLNTVLTFAVVAALPAASVSAVGDSVVLASDGHLYTFNGTSWIDQGTQPVQILRDPQGGALIASDQISSLKDLLTQILVELQVANHLTIALNRDATDIDVLRNNLLSNVKGESKC